MEDRFSFIISKMTLKEKIGQLIIGQAEGTEVSEDFINYISEYPLCGYRINGQNIRSKEQVKKFTSDISSLFKTFGCIEPLLGCDEEGGTLSVFSNLVTEFPGNMALGAAEDAYMAYLQGNVLAHQLSDMGINLVFAPVADINLQQSNPVIGVRSFGDNPEKVAVLCAAYAKGLNSGGTAACAKHFPGHGNTNIDSHYSLPSNSVCYKTLEETELVPFSTMTALEVDSIMVSHVLYPKIEDGNLPASMSNEIIGNLLREKLGYNGVIITDDLEMKAIIDNYSIVKAVKRFIIAGGDIALINGTRSAVVKAFEALEKAVINGEIEINRINASIRRILMLKERINIYRTNKRIMHDNPTNLSMSISKKSVTYLRDKNNILPLQKSNKVLIITPNQINLTEADTSGGKINNFYKFIGSYASEVINYNLDLKEDYYFIKEDIIRQCDVIIQCTINAVRFPKQLELLKELSTIKPTIAIMLRDPYEATLMPENVAVIATYSSNDNTMEVASALIYGEGTFLGKLPVKINNVNLDDKNVTITK
jgi:beta-N-acetylhexosaminidase